MEVETILKNLENVDTNYVALFIKDSTFDTIHYYLYNSTDIPSLLERIRLKYNSDLEYGHKKIIASLQSNSLTEIKEFYDTLK